MSNDQLILEHIMTLMSRQGQIAGELTGIREDISTIKNKIDNCRQDDRIGKIESDIFEMVKLEEKRSGMVKVIVTIGGFIGGLISILFSWFVSKL